MHLLERLVNDAKSAARTRCLIDCAGMHVGFAADNRQGVDIIDAVFGRMCHVSDVPLGRGSDEWEFVSAVLPDYEHCRRQVEVEPGSTRRTVKRWCGDHA